MMLDLLATIFSDGLQTAQLENVKLEEGASQAFLCFDMSRQPPSKDIDTIADELIDYIHATTPIRENERISYPGERTLQIRQENLEKGIPIDETRWRQVLEL